MKTIREILKEKGSQVWSVAPDASVGDALAVMAAKNVGALVVTEKDKPVGIFSERDYARGVVSGGKVSLATPVRELMTSKMLYVHPDQSLEECMALMTDKRVRHLPVMEADCLIGLISIGDVVKAIISEQSFMIEQLEHYITGTR